MLIGVVGDVHGEFEALERVLTLEAEIPAWLCVGDVASDSGEYPSPARPFYFIQGNNEDFDALARMSDGCDALSPPGSTNLRFIPNGTLADIAGLRVAGLGGTFAPKWFDTAPEALADHGRAGLPPTLKPRRTAVAPGEGGQTRRAGGPSGAPRRDDKRRHFVRGQVDACLAMRDVDILLSHEAPRPYWAGSGSRRNDAGKAVINEILAAMRPRLHFFGHHHRHSEATREGVPSIGLPLVNDGYLVIETTTWGWTRRALHGE